MQSDKKLLNIKNIIIFSIFAIVYFQFFYSYHKMSILGGNSFTTSDWLINYNYGFIRRGMSRTILFMFSNKPNVITYYLYIKFDIFHKHSSRSQAF